MKRLPEGVQAAAEDQLWHSNSNIDLEEGFKVTFRSFPAAC